MENTNKEQTQTQLQEKQPMPIRCANYLAEEFIVNDNKPITAAQKHIIQGYIEGIVRVIENSKPVKNKPAISWNNIDYKKLKRSVYVNTHLGLDMWQDNMLSIVPFYNNDTKQYNLNLMRGYNGIKHLAETYSKDKIINITTELIYKNDKFIAIKKDANNNTESYVFEITNMFDRGELLGGFGYIEYEDSRKNKLILMTKADMDKRKPLYASAEFWGGEKTTYENGTPVKNKIEGWQDEMYLKTLIRYVCNQRHIPLDTSKISDLFVEAEMLEMQATDSLNHIDEHSEPEKIVEADFMPQYEVVQEEKQEYIPEIEQVQQNEVIQEEIPQTQPQQLKPQDIKINRDDL